MPDPIFELLWSTSLESGRLRAMTAAEFLGAVPRIGAGRRRQEERPDPDASFLLAQKLVAETAVKQGIFGNEHEQQDVRDLFDELTGAKDREDARAPRGQFVVAPDADAFITGATTTRIVDDPHAEFARLPPAGTGTALTTNPFVRIAEQVTVFIDEAHNAAVPNPMIVPEPDPPPEHPRAL